MMFDKIVSFSLVALTSLFSQLSLATSTLPLGGEDRDVIYLRTDCTGEVDCATTFNEIINWTWIVRTNNSRPLLIDVGPGEFDTLGKTVCSTVAGNSGNLTIRGSGRDNTVFSHPNGIPLFSAVLIVKDCPSMSFQDFTVKANAGGAERGVAWFGAGNSNWTNVQIDAPRIAWADFKKNTYVGDVTGAQCQAGEFGRHNFYSVTLKITESVPTSTTGSGAVAHHSQCGDSWYWGSEIVNSSSANSERFAVKAVGSEAEVHIYGSNVRVASSVANANPMTGLRAESGGIIHFHGGEVVVSAEGSGNQSVIGSVAIDSGSRVHTHETSYGLKATGTGTVTRLSSVNSGSVEANFTWSPGDTPPNISSVNGADFFVETNCASTGCQDTGNETHLHIYNDACNADGPWFDVVTKKCRGL